MRTYIRADLDAARLAWSDFGPEWRELRTLMADRTIFPPFGSPTDDRDDAEPSQRAIIFRALDFRHASTLALARRSRSWGELIARILAEENGIRELTALDEREVAWHREQAPSARQATSTILGILERIWDSRP